MAARPNSGLREHLGPFVEQYAEGTTACLLAMVRGDLLSLSWSHWLVASRTGAFADRTLLDRVTTARWNV